MHDPEHPGNAPEPISAPALEAWQLLRQQAENIVQKKAVRSVENLDTMTVATMKNIVHELRVHQIELELQNEEMRRSKLELEYAKSRYFELYDLAPVGYLTLNEKGLITEANLRIAEMMNIGRKDFLGCAISHFLHKQDQDVYYLLRKKFLITTAPQSCELRMVRANGSFFWAKLVATQVGDESGTVHLIVTDIDAHKKEQIEEKNQTNFIRAVADSVPGLFGYWDTNLRCVFANEGYLEWFGKPEEKMLGITMQELMGEELFAKNEPYIRAALAGANQQFERELTKPNGERGSVLVQYNVHSVNGVVKGFFALVTDITPLKKFEEDLQQLLAEKTGLLNEVHHRVKNNLQVITSLLRLESGRSDQENTKAVLNEMQARIRTMALLHESLYRSGIFASVDLGDYLKQVASQAFRAQISKASAISLQLDLVSVQVSMDQAMPCGLMVNELISNCFKHAFPQGQSGELKVSLQPYSNTDQWQIHVGDNGVGLPDDFETRREGALGLQLATDLARQIGSSLEVNRGALQAETQKVQGAQFSVIFSIVDEKSVDPDRRKQ